MALVFVASAGMEVTDGLSVLQTPDGAVVARPFASDIDGNERGAATAMGVPVGTLREHVIVIPRLVKDGIVEPLPPEPDATVTAASIPELIAQYPWPVDQAMRIAQCESGMRADAYNPSGASGVFQLMMPLHAWRLAGASPFDPDANIRVAYSMWLESGWRPWIVGGCSP